LGDSEQQLEQGPGVTLANSQNIHDLKDEYGPSTFDVEFINVTSVVYDLPFGHGRQFLRNMNPVLDTVVGGWQLTGINTANTGVPINVWYSPSTANDVTGLATNSEYRGTAILRPNASCAPVSQSTAQSLLTYFAGCTFTTPSPNNPFGNLSRNAFRAPNFEQWDLGVYKNFSIGEKINLQFRSEFFNVLNHTNFGVPNQQSNSTAFGTTTTTYAPRQIQFALKLLF
jgi:hypothetical protein